jgi:hypothetical protein
MFQATEVYLAGLKKSWTSTRSSGAGRKLCIQVIGNYLAMGQPSLRNMVFERPSGLKGCRFKDMATAVTHVFTLGLSKAFARKSYPGDFGYARSAVHSCRMSTCQPSLGLPIEVSSGIEVSHSIFAFS